MRKLLNRRRALGRTGPRVAWQVSIDVDLVRDFVVLELFEVEALALNRGLSGAWAFSHRVGHEKPPRSTPPSFPLPQRRLVHILALSLHLVFLFDTNLDLEFCLEFIPAK